MEDKSRSLRFRLLADKMTKLKQVCFCHPLGVEVFHRYLFPFPGRGQAAGSVTNNAILGIKQADWHLPRRNWYVPIVLVLQSGSNAILE